LSDKAWRWKKLNSVNPYIIVNPYIFLDEGGDLNRERSAGAIIFREEGEERYYLLLYHPVGHWDFPKGHIEKKESEIKAAIREIKEETGIGNLEFVDGFRKEINYNFRRKDKLVYKEVVFYLSKTEKKEVKLSFEHKDYVWLPYTEALERLSYDNSKNILKMAEIFIENKE
jgi:NTP pyrophosphohydrolases including oxidative damage repair enzymes